MSRARPFRIDVSQAVLDRIAARIDDYRWFDPPEGGGDEVWAHGASTSVLKDLIAHWQTDYDWRAAEADLNRHPHFKAEIDGLDIHFLHIVGEAEGKRPLLITHGWPGSFFEFWEAIEPLAYPTRHGGQASDAFDLIIPSLPGYAFSGKPKTLLGSKSTAPLWDKLMRDVLGYETYLAQGGDWGAMVTSWIGLNHGTHNGKGGCKAIHLNICLLYTSPSPRDRG